MALGVPCVGASSAGKSKRRLTHAESHPEAGALFYQSLRLIEQFTPGMVVLENVGNYQDTASMEVVRSLLSAWGYTSHEAILDGNTFGALENRKRLVVIAVSKGLQRLSGFDMDQVVPLREKEEKLSDIFEPIADDDKRWTIHEYLEKKEESDRAAGKGFMRQLFTGAESYIAVVTRCYAKIRSTDPHIKHPTKPRYTRLLTAVEHARVKAVPAGWIESTKVANCVMHEILGQGVIWSLFEAVGAAIGAALHRAARWFVPAPDAASANDNMVLAA
ncbi:MAG: DNA (cytosine-5-)-methyltransferase [Marinobacter sp. T13-3]|nr:MAG: DNA (cytosine-5-)-methyltransferase [Marinobacter sp. T13-3]